MLGLSIVALIIIFFLYQHKKDKKKIQEKIDYEQEINSKMNQLAREDADDRTREIKRYMSSKILNHKKKRRMDMDNHTCLLCTSKKNLEVHHITYMNIGHESLRHLRTVCDVCHKMIHEEMGYPSYDPWDYLKGWFWKDEWDNNKGENHGNN